MRPLVERSQSLRADISRGSGSESPASNLRPKVSFNRAVHVKRISRRLADVLEDEDSPDYSDASRPSTMTTNGYSTLPRRGGNTLARNGTKKPDGVQPSDRLSRLIRTDPRSEDERKQEAEQAKTPQKKKKTLSERVRGMFSSKRSPARKENHEDDLKARYTEFKGTKGNSSSDATDNETDHRYTSKRRGSAPETRTSWFRSIDRLKKNDDRKERYFGESDNGRQTFRGLQKSPRRNMDSSNDSATEQEGMSRAPSLVYLHTAAVGDIPHRAATPSRRLSRSVSVLAPWAPKSRPPRPTRTRSTQTGDEPEREQTLLRPPPRHHAQSKSLPKLVFTGPSIEDTVGRSTLHRTNIQMRGRK